MQAKPHMPEPTGKPVINQDRHLEMRPGRFPGQCPLLSSMADSTDLAGNMATVGRRLRGISLLLSDLGDDAADEERHHRPALRDL